MGCSHTTIPHPQRHLRVAVWILSTILCVSSQPSNVGMIPPRAVRAPQVAGLPNAGKAAQ